MDFLRRAVLARHLRPGLEISTTTMPRGDKSSYSGKQKRQASHIEASYRKRGVSEDEAEERAWRTVNKQTGGARKKRATRKKSTAKKSGTKRSRSRSSSGSRKKTTRARRSKK